MITVRVLLEGYVVELGHVLALRPANLGEENVDLADLCQGDDLEQLEGPLVGLQGRQGCPDVAWVEDDLAAVNLSLA